MANSTVLILVVLLATARFYYVNSRSYVPCKDQQEACICDESQDICKFRLDIEELQTFTSYRITETGQLITRGTPGDTYYLDQAGFHPSLDSSTCNGEGNQPFECGHCRNNQYTTIPPTQSEMFRTNLGCSLPMTVDGRTYRQYIAVNGRIPGPTLVVTEGQKMIVEVRNKLTSEGVTIHWHGIHQRDTPWMDGVASLSHIPIVPGGQFEYNFTASPAGTHWYHSHLGAQRTDGLFGGLIVREKSMRKTQIENDLGLGPIVDMPGEHTLSLLDWQRESSLNLFTQIHSTLGFYPSKQLGEVPRPSDQLYSPRAKSIDGIEVGPVPYFSGLINGRGRYNANTDSVLSVFTVNNSNQYRFRLIGAQSLYAFRFEIDGHRLRIIATDGHFIEPITVDYLIIHSGERYDFIPIRIDTTANNYMIRAKTLENNVDHSVEAILNYEGFQLPTLANRYTDNIYQPTLNRCTSSYICTALNCPFKSYPETEYINCLSVYQLTALYSVDESKLPTLDVDGDRLLFFNFGFEGQSSINAINGINFLPPATPYQTNPGQYDADKKDSSKITCERCTPDVSETDQATKCTCINVREIFTSGSVNPSDNSDKSIVMVFSAVGKKGLRDFAHPIHLHGHSFFVVHTGYGQYAENGTLIQNSRDVVCDFDNDRLCMNPFWRNRTPPDVLSLDKVNESAIQKDTVLLPAGGYVVIAFQADNPGYWFLHCHIEVHQLEGMAIIIKEYPDNKHPSAPAGINNVGEFPSNNLATNPNNINSNLDDLYMKLMIAFVILSFILLVRLIITCVLLCCYYHKYYTDTH